MYFYHLLWIYYYNILFLFPLKYLRRNRLISFVNRKNHRPQKILRGINEKKKKQSETQVIYEKNIQMEMDGYEWTFRNPMIVLPSRVYYKRNTCKRTYVHNYGCKVSELLVLVKLIKEHESKVYWSLYSKLFNE